MPATKERKHPAAPTSIRPSPDLRARIEKIAQINGLKAAVVYQLALAGGLTIVETKLAEIRENRDQPTPEVAR